jgi:hypothetical protein
VAFSDDFVATVREMSDFLGTAELLPDERRDAAPGEAGGPPPGSQASPAG